MVREKVLLFLIFAGVVFGFVGEVFGDFASEVAESRQIIADKPGTDEAMRAQMRLTLLYIRSDKVAEANSACEELLTKYAGQEDIVEATYSVGGALQAVEDYGSARELYKLSIETRPITSETDDRKKGLAKVTVLLAKAESADDVAGRLIRDYSDEWSAAEAAGRFGRAGGQLGDYELARELYEGFIQKNRQDSWAVWAQMGVATTSVGLGDEEGMEAALSKLGTDFAGDVTWQKIGGVYSEFCRYLLRLRGEDKDDVEEVLWKKILSDFMEDGGAVVVLDHMGDIYRDRREYERAAEVFAAVADGWRGVVRL